jgi:uncharacterized protein
MRILDIHVHVGNKQHLRPEFVQYITESLGPRISALLDGFGVDQFLMLLQQEEIAKTAVLAEYSPKVTGVVPNEYVAQFCAVSEKLIPFCSVNLNDDCSAVEQVNRAIHDLKCKGIKLLPSYGHFYPDDERLLPVYDLAQSCETPVMFHTGSSLFPGTRIKYANPLFLEGVAEEFPKLPFIMSHGGRPFWYKEAEWMLRRNKNVYIDVSGIPPHHLKIHFPKIESFRDRFVFGSDWPNIPSIRDQVTKIENLGFSEQVLQDLFWNNGAKLLKLES